MITTNWTLYQLPAGSLSDYQFRMSQVTGSISLVAKWPALNSIVKSSHLIEQLVMTTISSDGRQNRRVLLLAIKKSVASKNGRIVTFEMDTGEMVKLKNPMPQLVAGNWLSTAETNAFYIILQGDTQIAKVSVGVHQSPLSLQLENSHRILLCSPVNGTTKGLYHQKRFYLFTRQKVLLLNGTEPVKRHNVSGSCFPMKSTSYEQFIVCNKEEGL